MIIGHGRVRMDPAKIRAIEKWPEPQNLTELRGFLGFANFYRRFIEGFAENARPLNNLMKKNEPWDWKPIQQNAFDKLKRKFTSEPFLVLWQPDRPTHVMTDTSQYALRGAIEQQVEDGTWHPVAF